MSKFLRRRWFLLVLCAGLALALMRPDWFLGWTAHLEPRLIVGLALFLVAWTLPSRRLAGEITSPWAALFAVFFSYGILPAAAWLLGGLIPNADCRIGILVITSVPCTLASAVIWTRMSGGNEATALLVIVATTATSWLFTTGWLLLTTGATAAAGSMMQELLLTLVAPVALGQLCRTLPAMVAAANRQGPAVNILAQLLVLAIILKAAAEVGDRIAHGVSSLDAGSLVGAAVLCAVLHLGTLASSFRAGAAAGFDRPRRIAIAFASSQKTLPVALVLYRHFQDRYPMALLPLLLYHVGQLVADTLIADALRRQGRKAAGP